MILRNSTDAPRTNAGETRPGWQVFLETQKKRNTIAAEALVLQIAHSSLAGQLAGHLTNDAFGRLPPEVVEAAAKHDLGWAESDERQIAENSARGLRPFPEMKEDELPSWRRSLHRAEEWSPLTQVLISRHFSALANQPSPEHEEFLRTEATRRETMERSLGYPNEDLKRWAAAVGLCDLLSLYLCSGTQESAEFPLAHPAESDADDARTFTIAWRGGCPGVSLPLFREGAELHIGALAIGRQDELNPTSLKWTIQVSGKRGE